MLDKIQSTISIKQPKVLNLSFLSNLKGYVLKVAAFPKKHPFVTITTLAVLVALFGATKLAGNSSGDQNTIASVGTSSQFSVNKQISVPIKAKDGKETGKELTFSLTTIEKAEKILVNGKPASTKEGKSFVVVNLEINNPTTNQLNTRPVDLVRLITSDGKTFAPDIHNDTVKVEPLSLKKTRVSFVVEDGLKDYKLTFGEINGQKQDIDIKF